jgi:hypothetical protein
MHMRPTCCGLAEWAWAVMRSHVSIPYGDSAPSMLDLGKIIDHHAPVKEHNIARGIHVDALEMVCLSDPFHSGQRDKADGPERRGRVPSSVRQTVQGRQGRRPEDWEELPLRHEHGLQVDDGAHGMQAEVGHPLPRPRPRTTL